MSSIDSAVLSCESDRGGLTAISYLKGRDKLHIYVVREESPVVSGVSLPSAGGSALHAKLSLNPDGTRGLLSRGNDISFLLVGNFCV